MRHTRKLAALAGALVLGLGITPLPAQAEELPYISGPGSTNLGWTQPILVVRPGDTVKYTNLDTGLHNVVSDGIYGPDTAWCAAAQFAPGTCPLVWSPLIGIGKSTPVYGLENLHAGDVVRFICKIHPNMVGEIHVLDA